MSPLEVAARFTAFTWYVNNRQAPPRTKQAEARRFADSSWQEFLPVAHPGLGKLLLRLAKPTTVRRRSTGIDASGAARRLLRGHGPKGLQTARVSKGMSP